MRALGEPDAFPSGDLGLLRALALETPRELEQRAEAWRPWRGYAAMYLWRGAGQSVQAERNRRFFGKSKRRPLQVLFLPRSVFWQCDRLSRPQIGFTKIKRLRWV